MIESGSKGKKKNITQMKGFLGQQIVNGKEQILVIHTEHYLISRNIVKMLHKRIYKKLIIKGLHPFEFFSFWWGKRGLN